MVEMPARFNFISFCCCTSSEVLEIVISRIGNAVSVEQGRPTRLAQGPNSLALQPPPPEPIQNIVTYGIFRLNKVINFIILCIIKYLIKLRNALAWPKLCSGWHIQDAYYKYTRFKEFEQYSLNK